MKEKLSILIADDNQEFSHTLSSYINSQEDMEVIAVAKDGNEAVGMMSNTMPDVVLLDVIMPHLDGLGVLEKINMIKIDKKPICIKYGSYTSSIVSTSSPIVAASVSKPTGPPLYFNIIVSRIFLSISSNPISSISNLFKAIFAISSVTSPFPRTDA